MLLILPIMLLLEDQEVEQPEILQAEQVDQELLIKVMLAEILLLILTVELVVEERVQWDLILELVEQTVMVELV